MSLLATGILPSLDELWDAIPVILSLVLIEALLSVDNALAIAAMARHLPKEQQQLALRLGIVGAYGFRGLSMAFAAWIIENPLIKICGAVYLIYLTCKHFSERAEKPINAVGRETVAKGLVAMIVSIEIMDLSLSVDNVVAAVAMSPKLWVVCTGVFVGILALRFVAGACLKLLEKFPILEDGAFLLIGYVGLLLFFELLSDPKSGLQLLPGPVHVNAFQKFAGVVLLLGLSIGYSKSKTFQTVLRPLLQACSPIVWLVSNSVGLLFKALLWPGNLVLGIFCKKNAASQTDPLDRK